MKRFGLLLLIITLVSCTAQPAFAQHSIPDRHDRAFRAWSAVYMPGRDWKLLKAQCWQESRFRTDAISPVGAKGICQFMPATWTEQERELKKTGSPFDFGLNIQFAAYYMSKQLRFWRKVPVALEADKMAVASYNAGAGNINRAWKLCQQPNSWETVATCLPRITGRHSTETITYVKKIWEFYRKLLA